MKRVSVVIPAFNHAEYIGQAIQSVLNCNFPNIEIIVVDDGATDHTQEVVSSYKSVLYYFQENQGAHAALNRGLSLTSGEYVAILNDDDLYFPDHLMLAYYNLETFANDIYLGKPSLIGKGRKLDVMNGHASQSIKEIESLGLIKSLFKINWSVSTTSFVFKRDLMLRVGGFQDYSICHDLDFLLRALFVEGVSVGTSPHPTWQYRCHETNSGSAISTDKQQAEIAYCLGKILLQTKRVDSREDFFNLIGYGITIDLKTKVWVERPWDKEEFLGTDESIRLWVESYS